MIAIRKLDALRSVARVVAVAAVLAVAGCATPPAVTPGSTADRERVRPEDLFIVDCLLPPQVRQLGENFTYLAARQPVRTTANDCATRGGEYVAYDQANYASALKVWLTQAQAGDAQAQTIVGEIYEEGSGGAAPDYALAAQWYRKAADQGDSRAQINLGSLYERGRGVPQDLAEAMNWYRRASGLEGAALEMTTEEELTRRRIAAEEANSLRREVIALKQRLAEAATSLQARRDDLRKAESELNRLRLELVGADAGGDELAARLERTQRRQDAGRAEAIRLQAQVRAAEAELARTRRLLRENESALAGAEAARDALRREVAVAAGTSRVGPLETRLRDAEAALVAQRRASAAQEKRLREQLAAAEARAAEARLADRVLQAQLVARDEEIAELRAELSAAQGELAQARRQLADQRNASSEIARLELEVARGRAEIAEYEETTQALREELGISAAGLAANAPPQIDILTPAVGVTRGLRRAELYTSAPAYEVVGRVTPADELRALRLNDASVLDTLDGNGLFQVTVPLSSATETPVNIEAIRANGLRAQEQFTLVRAGEPALPPRATSPVLRDRMRQDLGRYHALVIGNNRYRALDDLGTAVNDAQTIAAELGERYGFAVTLLTNATRADIVFELARLTQSLGEYDNLLIYYAGHGIVDDDSGQGYWLGVDADPLLPGTWIGNEQVSEFLGAMQAKHVLVVADSCYAGTLSGNAIRPLPLDIRDEDLLFISRVRARTVLTSGGLQPVLDDGGSGHSIFGEAFLDALRENRDLMEGYRLFDAVRRQVVPRSRLARIAQDPEYSALQHAGHEGSEFFLVPLS